MPKIQFDFNKLAQQTLQEIGDVLVEQSKENMDKTSFGRSYIIGGQVHIASKSGDSANNLSGALKDSIRFEIKGKVLEFGAGDSSIDYAKYLEVGTGKMDSRPNYTKSIVQNENRIGAKVQDLFSKSIGFR